MQQTTVILQELGSDSVNTLDFTSNSFYDTFDSLNFTTNHQNVTVNGNLQLEHEFYDTIPEQIDHWTETNCSLNGSISFWFEQNENTTIRLNNTEKIYGENSIEFQINGTEQGIGLGMQNVTEFDASNTTHIQFYLKIADIDLEYYNLTIYYVVLGNGTPIAFLPLQKITNNEWNQYIYNLDNFVFGIGSGELFQPLNRSEIQLFAAAILIDGDQPDHNFSVYIDYLMFGSIRNKSSGFYLSDWIIPPEEITSWDHLTCVADNLSHVKLYVTDDNNTWELVNLSKPLNLKDYDFNKSGIRYLLWLEKDELGNSPLIDMVIIDYSLPSGEIPDVRGGLPPIPFRYSADNFLWITAPAMVGGLIIGLSLMYGVYHQKKSKTARVKLRIPKYVKKQDGAY